MKTTFGAMSPGRAAGIPSAVEFPSQRRERIDWHKLASVDLHELSSGCSIEVLQDHLSYITFCDAESEFDIGTSSGQRNLLKMFRLAQLIIQYLFLSQEFIETQLKVAQDELVQITEKYQQVKAKLLQQVEAAKKMKTTNRNMRETVKYINSFALANGLFQSLKCPLCTKSFRGQDFLQSHLWRKHPSQVSSVTLPQTTQMPSAVSSSFVVPNVTSDIRQEVPHTSESVLQSAPSGTRISSNLNDIDSYKLSEIEKKCNTMNENFTKIMRELEEQKRSLERENKKSQEEVKRAREEKHHTERECEAQLEKLSEQLVHLQKTSSSNASTSDTERFVELIKKQEKEIQFLQAQIQRQTEYNKVDGTKNDDTVDGLSNEIQALKRQVSNEKKFHKQSLKQMQELLQRNYEEALESEMTKLREMMKDIAHKEAAVTVIAQKPPPSPKTPTVKKPPAPNRTTKPFTLTQDSPENSHMLTYPQANDEPHLHSVDTHDSETESESESETDTSQWNHSNLKVTQLQINSSSTERKKEITKPNIQRSDSIDSEHPISYSSEEDASHSESNSSSELLNLEALLKDNPQLWNQMREATSDVLASKLQAFGIDSSERGIKSEVLTSCLSQLRKDRRKLEENYENFLDLRKRLENEVRAKVDDKIDNAEDISGIYPLETVNSKTKEKQSSKLFRMVKNVRSKVKEQSQAFSSSVSRTSESMKLGVKDIFHTSLKSDDNIKAISGTRRVSDNPEETAEDEKGDESSSETDCSTQIEVHNETSKSVTRNLFNDEILSARSGARPKLDNYFDNQTYGEVEEVSGSEWDSEPEYENFKKEPPPKRNDSLNASLVSANLHNNTTRGWEPLESKIIKLKKPEGTVVSNLAQSIELQLSGRKKKKPVGAVDVMSGSVVHNASQERGTFVEHPNTNQSSSYASQQHSVSDSSNTVGTSLWGSVDAVDKVALEQPKLFTSNTRDTLHSWDSDDDIDVSQME